MTERPLKAWESDRNNPIVTKRRGTSVVKAPLPLNHRWTTSIPGYRVHAFAGDSNSKSLLIGDGWGVPHGALRLHRLDAATGTETASIRTRHQGVNSLRTTDGRLLIATDSRLFDVTLPDIEVTHVWEHGLVRYAQQMEAAGEYVVQANWIRPTLGVLDTRSGALRRVKAAPQPLLFKFREEVRVVSALNGGMATVDVANGKLTERVSMPPVSAIAAGRDIWAGIAGPPQAPEVYPPLPVNSLPQFRRGTNSIIRITDGPAVFTLDGTCSRLWCDDEHGLLWCFIDEVPGSGSPTRLEALRQATGDVVARYDTETAATFFDRDPELGIVPVQLAYLDVALGIVATTQYECSRRRGNVGVSDSSTLTCYSLPDL